jgi:excisionase family DNA binding protein
MARSRLCAGQKYITIREAAARLGLAPITIRKFLTAGKLRRYKVGARTLVRASEVDSLVKPA